MATFLSNVNANFLLNTLSQTLKHGNNTDGTTIIITDGDGIVGEDLAGGGTAGSVPISGGENTGGGASDDGGDVFLLGGTSAAGTGGVVQLTSGEGLTGGPISIMAGRSLAANVDGGDVLITGGDTAVGGTGEGGGILLTGVTPQSSGSGGVITIRSGSGGIGGGNTSGGLLSLIGGDGMGTSPGGDVDIVSGMTLSGTAISRVHIAGGDGPVSGGVGSNVEIEGGDADTGGVVLIEGGDALGASGDGGAILLVSGRAAPGGVGTSGDINITVRAIPPADPAVAGQLLIRGGDSGTAGPGGNVVITAGNTNSPGIDQGGSVNINAGNSLTGGPGAGGDIFLNTGQSSGTGPEGVVEVVRGGLQLNERPAVFGPPITAGQGRLWLRDDSPNALMFTDDIGTDIVISQIRNLANTLLIGNFTGGTDLILTAGDTMVPSVDGGANLGSILLRFGEVHQDTNNLENATRSSGNRQTIGAVQAVISAIHTLSSDGDVITAKVDIVGSSTTLGSALSQQMLFSFFRDGTVQNLSAVTNNTNYVGTLSTAKASLSINALAIDLVFTGEAGHTINWAAHWEITHL